MGARAFQHTINADTAEEAFHILVSDAEAEWEHQQGYSGRINTKQSFRVLRVTDDVRKQPQPYIDRGLEAADPWDHDAYAIDLGPVTYTTHQPAPATRCEVTVLEPHSGPIKWQTVYEITGVVFGMSHHGGPQLIREERSTKTDALKRAKELAVAHQSDFDVAPVKKAAHRPITRVSPKRPPAPKNGRRVTTRRWVFFGLAPE